MKYNLFYLLTLCGLLFAACQSETEIENPAVPDWDSDGELQEVSFSFSFDAALKVDIEYEPLTRGDGEEAAVDGMKISNTFNWVILSQYDGEERYRVVKTGVDKFDPDSEDDRIYIPGEYGLHFKELLPPGDYMIAIFTGQGRVVFNHDEIRAGEDITPETFAIRYIKKDVKMIVPEEVTLTRNGSLKEYIDEDSNILHFQHNMLSEAIFYGKGTFTVVKPEHLDHKKTIPSGCTIEFVNKTCKARMLMPRNTLVDGVDTEEIWSMFNPQDEPVALLTRYYYVAADNSKELLEGLNILGNSWYSEKMKASDYAGLFCYPYDQEIQTDSEGKDYMVCTDELEMYMYLFYDTDEISPLYFHSGFIAPIKSINLYNPEWETSESTAFLGGYGMSALASTVIFKKSTFFPWVHRLHLPDVLPRPALGGGKFPPNYEYNRNK